MAPPTTFDRFAVPNADDGSELHASARLETHADRGMETELTIHSSPAVRWIKLRLSGGIEIHPAKRFIKLGEIIDCGTQEPVKLVDHFNGSWKRGSLVVALSQEGTAVARCYEAGSKLTCCESRLKASWKVSDRATEGHFGDCRARSRRRAQQPIVLTQHS